LTSKSTRAGWFGQPQAHVCAPAWLQDLQGGVYVSVFTLSMSSGSARDKRRVPVPAVHWRDTGSRDRTLTDDRQAGSSMTRTLLFNRN